MFYVLHVIQSCNFCTDTPPRHINPKVPHHDPPPAASWKKNPTAFFFKTSVVVVSHFFWGGIYGIFTPNLWGNSIGPSCFWRILFQYRQKGDFCGWFEVGSTLATKLQYFGHVSRQPSVDGGRVDISIIPLTPCGVSLQIYQICQGCPW